MRRALRYGLAWQPRAGSPQAVASLARQYTDLGGVGLRVRARMSVSEPPPPPDSAFATFAPQVGPAEYLAEQLAGYAALGATYVSVVPGYDDRSCAETIEALGRAKQDSAAV